MMKKIDIFFSMNAALQWKTWPKFERFGGLLFGQFVDQ